MNGPNQVMGAAAKAWRDCRSCGCAQFLAVSPETPHGPSRWTWVCGSCGRVDAGQPGEESRGVGRVSRAADAGEPHYSRSHRIDFALKQQRQHAVGRLNDARAADGEGGQR